VSDTYRFSEHAADETAADRLTAADVIAVVEHGEVIEDYQTAWPLPAKLSFAMVGTRPVHVVWALDAAKSLRIIVTTYVADESRWMPDWKTRRPKP
jgi:hypothetical protein